LRAQKRHRALALRPIETVPHSPLAGRFRPLHDPALAHGLAPRRDHGQTGAATAAYRQDLGGRSKCAVLPAFTGITTPPIRLTWPSCARSATTWRRAAPTARANGWPQTAVSASATAALPS